MSAAYAVSQEFNEKPATFVTESLIASSRNCARVCHLG